MIDYDNVMCRITLDEHMINIVVASDKNYVPHLETLIVSIGENCRDSERINIHIFDDGIPETNKRFITELSGKYSNLSFSFYSISDAEISDLLGGSVSKDRSLMTYARLLIPDIIDCERALYLDVDAIVCDSLDSFYYSDMNGYAIAGVLDTNPIDRHRKVGLEDKHSYICAGMILFNLKKCREIDFLNQCVSFVKSRDGIVDAMDQGTINGVCGRQGLVKTVHPRYDVLTSLYQLSSEQIKKIYNLSFYYSDIEINEAKENPVFILFTPNMTSRPWVKNCRHPMKNEYWKYRNLTEFGEYTLQNDTRSIKLRILGVLYRNFPSVYKKIIDLRQQ